MKRLLKVVLSSMLLCSILAVGSSIKEVLASGSGGVPPTYGEKRNLTVTNYAETTKAIETIYLDEGYMTANRHLDTARVGRLFDYDNATYWQGGLGMNDSTKDVLTFHFGGARWIERIELKSSSDYKNNYYKFDVEYKMQDGTWVDQDTHWTDDGIHTASYQTRTIWMQGTYSKLDTGIYGVRLTATNYSNYKSGGVGAGRLGAIAIYGGTVENPLTYGGGDTPPPSTGYAFLPTGTYPHVLDYTFPNGVNISTTRQHTAWNAYFMDMFDSRNDTWWTPNSYRDGQNYSIELDFRDCAELEENSWQKIYQIHFKSPQTSYYKAAPNKVKIYVLERYYTNQWTYKWTPIDEFGGFQGDSEFNIPRFTTQNQWQVLDFTDPDQSHPYDELLLIYGLKLEFNNVVDGDPDATQSLRLGGLQVYGEDGAY